MTTVTVDLGEWLAGQGKEDEDNKVTSLSSSSTDTEYPSAKCVYDEIDAINDLIGDAITYINQ